MYISYHIRIALLFTVLLFVVSFRFAHAVETMVDPLPPVSPTIQKDIIRAANRIASPPSVEISNDFLTARSSTEGRFIIGTTGGAPNTQNDDNKRILYGFPGDVGSSFTTLRVVNGNSTSDYRLGGTDWSTAGSLPVSPPSSNGTTISSSYLLEGIQVVEQVYFVQNSSTGRPDTTAVEYVLTNQNSSPKDVGLRVMMDTMVGDNDGAPYFILGTGQVSRQFEWNGTNIPEYWIAYESTSFAPDSLKSRGQLKGDNTIPPDRFVIADWPQAQGTVWDYTVDPTDEITNDSAVILYYNPKTLAAGQSIVYRTNYGIGEAGGTATLELVGLEVTQGIQSWENDDSATGIPIIEGKKTYVRAHVKSTSGTVNNVDAKLIGRRNGSELAGSPLSPQNAGITINVLENPSRQVLEQSFYFEVPSTWLTGAVEFDLKSGNTVINCKDHADTHDDCQVEVTFLDTAVPEIRMVGIIWEDQNGVLHDPDAADYGAVVVDMEAEYPVSDIDWDNPLEITWPTTGIPSLSDILARLNQQRTLDNSDRIYYGLLIDWPGNTGLGLGERPGNVSAGYLRLSDPTTGSHEVGHNLDRRHTNCTGTEQNADSNYPHNNGWISTAQSGDNAFFGFHIGTRQIFPPSTGDLLGYCRPRWVSDHNYRALRNAIQGRFLASNGFLLAQSALLGGGEPAILVSGLVTPSVNTGQLYPSFMLNSPGSILAPAPGSYMVRFENSIGEELAAYSFEANVPEDSDEITGQFSLLLPRTDSIARIELYHYDQLLDVRTPSSNPPSVTLLSPNGGELLSGPTATIQWTAEDADGDALEYLLQYSTDAGATWQTLATGLRANTYELSLDGVAGSTQATMRVLASDGFHTAMDESNSVFTVANNVPNVMISAPISGSLYVGDQLIVFDAEALDAEDGQLAAASLVWTSDRDGLLGNGDSLAVNALNLSEGIHVINLTAEDSEGVQGSSIAHIEVFRNRPVLPTRLDVSPARLGFLATEGDLQTAGQALSIHNTGDGVLSWSVSADQSWILLSATQGAAPANIIIAADPTGLEPGEHTGFVTIETNDAQNSPIRVEVTFTVDRAVEAFFSASPLSGVAPLTVSIENLSRGIELANSWTFGDGESSSVISPTHVYNAAGVYTVTLTTSGPGGTDTFTRTNFIFIFEPVTAGFTASATSGNAPLVITFSNESTGSFTSLRWDFGDSQTSTATNPTHTYDIGGAYTVTLTASGPGGTDAFTRSNYISVFQPVIVGFTASVTSGNAPLVVTFTNESTGSFTDLRWDFGDSQASTDENPTHTYTAAGTYTVSLSLTASGVGGTQAETKVGYITVMNDHKLYLPLIVDQ